MNFFGEFLVKTIRFFVALAIVLLGYNWLSSLDQKSEDFLYLSSIVKKATDEKVTQEEQVKALTEWLSKNVIKSTEYPGWERPGYPDWFDGSSVAKVIKGGIGNCGYQANNIIVLSRYLGIRGNRRYWVGEQSGSKYKHAFAELIVDGKPRVFDPNILIFQENAKGEAVSLQDMIDNPGVVDNAQFSKIVTEIREVPGVLRTTGVPKTPEPLGKNSYAIYASFGSTATEMYLHLKTNPLTVITLSWLVFFIMSSSLDALSRLRRKKK